MQNSIAELIARRNRGGESNRMIRMIKQHGNKEWDHEELLAQRRGVQVSSSYSADVDAESAKAVHVYDDDQDLLMFDCFKVLCLLWLLAFGACQFTMGGSAYNPWTLMDYFQTVAYTLVYSANLGFEEFFMLSAFFSYVKLEKYLRERALTGIGPVRYLKIFLHRYLRLAPVYYLVFLTGWLIGSSIHAGAPWWYTYQMLFCGCQQYWWAVLTMTANEFPSEASAVVANEGCYYWGWFVAAEM